MLRVSEYSVKSPNSDPGHCPMIGDIALFRDRLSLFLPHSKASKIGVWLNVPASNIPDLCPVQAMKEYLLWRPSNPDGSICPGPLFLHVRTRKPLTSYQVNHVLGLTLKGLIPLGLKYSSHSFRIGAASHLADSKEFSDKEIKKFGRWKTQAAYKKYCRSLPTIAFPNILAV